MSSIDDSVSLVSSVESFWIKVGLPRLIETRPTNWPLRIPQDDVL